MNEFELKEHLDYLRKFAEKQVGINSSLSGIVQRLQNENKELSDKVYELTPKRKRK
jgi:hypothetical protein